MAWNYGTVTEVKNSTPTKNTPAVVAAAMKAAGSNASPLPSSPANASPSQAGTQGAVRPAISAGTVSAASQPVAHPSGWTNVVDVFAAPWNGQGILVNGQNIPVLSPAISAVTGLAEVGTLAYGGALAYTAWGGSAAVAAAASPGLKGAAVIGGAGLLVGALLNGGTKQTQGSNPVQQQGGTSTPQQNTTQNPSTNPAQGGSLRGGTNAITNSPGATISNPITYNQQQYTIPTYNLAQTPTQNTPFSQSASQPVSQSATDSGSMLLPALIVGAALLIGKR